jgi:anti-sigma factor RsiW
MRCKNCRKTVMASRPAEWSAAVEAHLRDCDECRRVAADVQRMAALLSAMGDEHAPEGLTASVMAQVRTHETVVRAPWYERAFGLLRAPAPGLSLRHGVAVAAVALMVASVGVYVGQQDDATTLPTRVPSVATASGRTEAEMEEMIYRNLAASGAQPLADDEGMRLVRY